jgi:hypothetical protein
MAYTNRDESRLENSAQVSSCLLKFVHVQWRHFDAENKAFVFYKTKYYINYIKMY